MVTTAASTTATGIQTGLAAQPGTKMGFVIENETSDHYSIVSYAPTHGHWVKPPDNDLYGTDYIYQKFQNALKAKYGDNPTDSEISTELAFWNNTGLFKSEAPSAILSGYCVGDGMGVETVILLQNTTIGDVTIAVLFRKIPGGLYGIGLRIQSDWDNNNFKNYWSGWSNCAALIDHIHNEKKESQDADCTQRFTDGGFCSVTRSGISVESSAPGEQINITIKNSVE